MSCQNRVTRHTSGPPLKVMLLPALSRTPNLPGPRPPLTVEVACIQVSPLLLLCPVKLMV